ncbi:hypothetical protein [Maricaulis salignorans]|uniref:Uncharacterized protein n=1 Tax=Maricaulis salignorans TaxID=144026 RepID=A0A1G9LCU2_9PROT|nr:hypothetical protein [Maricaulis salignorans]SDL59714.1 hypothetical protein SAMN04488568_1016 [Maricaulis salignorans]
MIARYRLVEIVIAVSVVIISVASLFVAVYQSRVMDQTLAASVMPIMDYTTGNFSAVHQDNRIELDVRNNGLGPAQVHYLAMSYQGEPVIAPDRFIAQCCAPEGLTPDERELHIRDLFRTGRLNLLTDVVGGRVFAPQQRVVFATMTQPEDPESLAVWEAFNRARHGLELEICYCSVLEDCWTARFPQQHRAPVDQCEPRHGGI